MRTCEHICVYKCIIYFYTKKSDIEVSRIRVGISSIRIACSVWLVRSIAPTPNMGLQIKTWKVTLCLANTWYRTNPKNGTTNKHLEIEVSRIRLCICRLGLGRFLCDLGGGGGGGGGGGRGWNEREGHGGESGRGETGRGMVSEGFRFVE
jgi:hypothetical protein